MYTACPRTRELLAMLRGELPVDLLDELETHVTSCPECETTLDSLTENSDTCVRGLAMLPCSEEDEPALREMYRQLLAETPTSVLTTALSDRRAAPHARPSLIDEHEGTLPRTLGAYELLELIGQGATSAVYRAKHMKLDKLVAVKVLASMAHRDASTVSRFLAEMRAIGKLDHPHIIRASDAGEDQGRHYLVMEHAPGMDVSSLLQQLGPLDVHDACEIARQTADALGYAARNGLVHRDVKPSNLLLTCEGQIKLLDLGLVSFQNERQAPTESCPQTVILHTISSDDGNEESARGTADYMSPEQWTRFSQVDVRGDLYSLGCTLYKLLTGSPPYAAAYVKYGGKFQAHQQAPIPNVRAIRPSIPDGVQRIIHKLLAKDPSQRYATPAELAQALSPYSSTADLLSLAAAAGLPVNSHALRSRRMRRALRVDRRWLLALATSACVSLAVHGLRHHTVRPTIGTDQWRSLRPNTSYPFECLGGAQSGRWSTIANDAAIEDPHAYGIQCNQPSILRMGSPLRGTFTVRVALQQQQWTGQLGVVFGMRALSEEQAAGRVYQSVELVRIVDSVNEQSQPTERWKLVWSQVKLRRKDRLDQPAMQREPWADVE
ncbi:MAG: serine/threonine protein kinase, partial [Planctomycetales bacterium]|nr:serine/threonine protein kinase [Planctomycetales bacterium]